ncbi:MAG: DUF1631 family protein [Pseudomonadales bacterium]|nr:DUF1631 family protein [Pseudomonadales bacterium]
MNAPFKALPETLELIKQQSINMAFILLDKACKQSDFSANKTLLKQIGDIKKRFIEKQDAIFLRLISLDHKINRRGVIGEIQREMQKLALVDQEQLAFQVFSEHFIDSAQKHIGINMSLLLLRFEAVSDQELEFEDLPFSPQQLAQSFESALRPIELDRDEKAEFFRTLLSLTNRHYVQWLNHANNQFIDLGILADLNESDANAQLKRKQQKQVSAQKRKELMSSISPNIQLDDEGNAIAPDMDELLEQIHIPESSSEHIIDNHIMCPDITQSELLQVISELQPILLANMQKVDDKGYLQLSSDLTLVHQLEKQTSLGNFCLDKVNTNSISLMSMLFADLFSNDYIAMPIKALLEQLQVPLLKTALLEKNFFADSGNPAQLLLDIVSEQSVGWSPDKNAEKDFLYQKMASMVQLVNQGFDNSYAIFDDAIIDFKVFLKNHQLRVGKIEARIVSAEKSKVRFERAKDEAKKHNEAVFSPYELPEPLTEFFSQHWQQVLFNIHNKYDGQDNKEWKQAVSTETLLRLNFEGHSQADNKRALYALQKMMLHTGQHKADVNEALKKIIPFIKTMVKKNKDTELKDEINNAEDSLDGSTELSEANVVTEAPQLTASNETVLESSMTFVNDDNDSLIVDQEQALQDTADQAANTQENAIKQLQDQLSIGSWLIDETPEESIKVKIAAYIKHTDSYILVQRNGIKYANLNSLEMLSRLQEKQLILLESGPVFDRALESVINSIRTV